MADPEVMLRARALCVRPATASRPIITDLDLTVGKGELFFVRGGNGAGKSVLARTLLGLEAVADGELSILGRDVSLFTPNDWARWRRTVGYLPQEDDLLPELTVAQQLLLSLGTAGWEAERSLTRAAKVLEEVGLAGRAEALPRQLSFSEKKLILLARSLARLPILLVADQMLDGLDRETVYQLLSLVQDYRARGMTVLLFTQRLTAKQLPGCRGAYLARGRIIEHYPGGEPE
jgi:ABC-type multidrug transport system ATPase subunit